MKKERVVLFGASGTMGFVAFRELWKIKDRFDLVLLLRSSPKNRDLFKPYLKEAGLIISHGEKVLEGEGFKLIWGDATHPDDVEAAVKDSDWVLNAMACIPPEADYYPQRALDVNLGAVNNILKAIQRQPGGSRHICYMHCGTVAQTGDRLPPIHVGRVGDPIHPSVYDFYGTTKVKAEYAVMESQLDHWVSLRMSYIMPTSFKTLVELMDPIMFHVPLQSRMECISDRDAGYGLVKVLDIPRDSDFWGKAYNMSGGPAMRTSAFEYYDTMFKLMGLSGLPAATKRNWFTLRNFHLHYYEDSALLNKYLGHWRDTLDDYREAIRSSVPAFLKPLLGLVKFTPALQGLADKIAFAYLKNTVEKHRNGTRHWYLHGNDQRIKAFYKDLSSYEDIPDWDGKPSFIPSEEKCLRLDHGYDESREELSLDDLKLAAAFRGGDCQSQAWSGDLAAPVEWSCSEGHLFTARPYTILMAGHWCPQCVPPPWNYDHLAVQNPFLAQAWFLNHDRDENNFYDESCLEDILAADKG